MSVLVTLFSIESKAQTCHLQSGSSALVDSVVLPDSLLNQSPYVFNVDSLMDKQSANPPKYPWRAAAEVVGINATLLAVDYFILDADFAKVTSKTIKRNVRLNKWFWDGDVFHTNLWYHPYHGNLFFNAARSNGMNFWESIPYTLAGDLMWEIAGENELPSINDAISTGIGGLAIGESTYRLSNLVYHDDQRGWRRVAQELLGAAINPIRALNRIFTGEAWKIRPQKAAYHDDERLPVRITMAVGDRYVSGHDASTMRFHTPYLDLSVRYGDAFNNENKPFDYFTLDAGVVVGHQQHAVNHINLIGQLAAAPVMEHRGMQSRFGVYQHFNYEHTNGRNGGLPPYQLSEAASIGVGWLCRVPSIHQNLKFDQSFFLNGMLLGGLWSDYADNPFHRTYNMGSGFTALSRTQFSVGHRFSFSLDARFFRMYSWRGYEDVPADTPYETFSAQGERNQSSVWMLRPMLKIPVWRQWGLHLSGAYYHRDTHYTYRNDATARTYEVRLGLLYQLKK